MRLINIFFFIKGHFSKVYKAEYNGKVVAIKEYQNIRKSKNKKRFRLETFILGQINHRNIIRFIGIVTNKNVNKIVMEYVEGKRFSIIC